MRINFKLFDTFGWIAIASLLVCGLTGVFLIIPYNPSSAYLSVTTFITSNPAAALSRNMHYWSAQLFLLFTILHFIEHFKSADSLKLTTNKPKRIITKGIWLRLVLSVIVVFYLMLSGFILKDDADSRQAHLLLSTLLSSIPLIGNFLSSSLSGSEKSLFIVYLHHAATATIIIFIVIFEHVRSIKVKWLTFVLTSLFVIVISFFFRAPISMLDEAVMKGPWYFVGVQEMLHLTANPLVVVAILLFIIALVYIVPFTGNKAANLIKIAILIFGIGYLMLTVTGYFFRGPMYSLQLQGQSNYSIPATLHWNPLPVTKDEHDELIQIAGGIEGCMSCHSGMKGLSASHDPAVTGCYSCHGGDPFTLNASAAHRNMYSVPGNLSNASQTCGGSGCHDDIVQRVPKSMMATLSGIISVDKWVFGEIDLPHGHFNVNDLKNTAADAHLKNLCAGCHIGMEKTSHGNAEWLERGGGCLACHLTYDEKALSSLQAMQKSQKEKLTSNQRIKIDEPQFHPAIDVNITNDKCESCHSRSGRISMSYSGWHETQLKAIPADGENKINDVSANTTSEKYRLLPDGRIFTAMPADVHHEAGMLCIDCHNSYELMGDGKSHQHKEDAVKVKCIDCHPTTSGTTASAKLSETDRETQLIAWLRGWSEGDPRVIITSNEKQPLVNTRFGEKPTLIRKSDNKTLNLKAASPKCYADKAHERLTCEACHTAWVPQCIGCHNTYEKTSQGYDMTTRTKKRGTWVEYTGEYMANAPVLGIKDAHKTEKDQQVGIFSPGMIMTIDKLSYTGSGAPVDGTKHIFHRLYAPVSGHTTQKESRSCVSCHLDPMALGFGRGKLILTTTGKWEFEPEYVLNDYDQLPEDAWTGFLQNRNDLSVTRLNMRPFNVKEQKQILKAGACLTCHKENSDVIQSCLIDFNKTINRSTKSCIIPKD
jgi:hypothetical protein